MEEGVVVASQGSSESNPVDKSVIREQRIQNLAPYRIKPGEVLNPLGGGAGQHALARYIRDKSLEGTALADFLFDVVKGEGPGRIFSSMKDRLKAVELLLNRGWGQAPQTITFEKDANNRPLLDLTKLSPAEFEQFKSLALKIAPAAPEGDSEPKQASTVAPSDTIFPQDVPKVQPSENLGSSGMKL